MPGNSRRACSLARSPQVQSMLADESAADMKRRHEPGWGARRISWEAGLAAISSCSDHRCTTRKLCGATELQRAATWTKASVIVRPGKLRAQEAGSLQHVVPLKTRLEGSPPPPGGAIKLPPSELRLRERRPAKIRDLLARRGSLLRRWTFAEHISTNRVCGWRRA